MTIPSPELRQWQNYVNLFEEATTFVNAHTERPCDPVVLDPATAPWHVEDVRKSLMIALGRVSSVNYTDLLAEVTVTRASTRRFISLGKSMYDGDETRDDYMERLIINLYRAEEQPLLMQSKEIRFYDEWGDYRSKVLVDPQPERKLVGSEVVASHMIHLITGTGIPEMRSLLDGIIAAASTDQQIQQYPYISPLQAPSPNGQPK